MGFQEAMANVCAPISIRVDIDPGSLACGPQMPSLRPGGSIVEYDHGYCEGKEPVDAMGKLLQDIMCKMGACPPKACDLPRNGKPSFGKPDFGEPDDGEAEDDDDDPTAKWKDRR